MGYLLYLDNLKFERMEGGRLVKKIYRTVVEGNRERGRPKRRWMDGVKDCLNVRGITIQEAKECVKDRREGESGTH